MWQAESLAVHLKPFTLTLLINIPATGQTVRRVVVIKIKMSFKILLNIREATEIQFGPP